MKRREAGSQGLAATATAKSTLRRTMGPPSNGSITKIQVPTARQAFRPGGGVCKTGPLSPMDFKKPSNTPLRGKEATASPGRRRVSFPNTSRSRFGWIKAADPSSVETLEALKQRSGSKTILADVEHKTGWKAQDFVVPYSQLVKYRRVNEGDVRQGDTWVDVTGQDEKPLKRNVGILRYLGKVKFGEGIWAGIELKGATIQENKNDGSVDGVRYFTCPKGRGLFLKDKWVRRSFLQRAPPNVAAGNSMMQHSLEPRNLAGQPQQQLHQTKCFTHLSDIFNLEPSPLDAAGILDVSRAKPSRSKAEVVFVKTRRKKEVGGGPAEDEEEQEEEDDEGEREEEADTDGENYMHDADERRLEDEQSGRLVSKPTAELKRIFSSASTPSRRRGAIAESIRKSKSSADGTRRASANAASGREAGAAGAIGRAPKRAEAYKGGELVLAAQSHPRSLPQRESQADAIGRRAFISSSAPSSRRNSTTSLKDGSGGKHQQQPEEEERVDPVQLDLYYELAKEFLETQAGTEEEQHSGLEYLKDTLTF